MDDHRQLILEGWIIGDTVGDGARQDVAVAIFVLQAFAIEGGAASGAAEQEAAGAHVAGGPGEIADALEPEHRIVDVERDHRHIVVGVGG